MHTHHTRLPNIVLVERGMSVTLGGVAHVVYMRGVWFPLDTPERTKFWLLARAHACAVCRHRPGRSAWRPTRPKHVRDVMALMEQIMLYRRALAAGIVGSKEQLEGATAQMRRWGHKPIPHCLWGGWRRYGPLLLRNARLGWHALYLGGDYLHKVGPAQ